MTVQGFAAKGFEGVREAFCENFSKRHELGGACCIYHQGQKVVDLWGGIRNTATSDPWEEDTMVVVFSATKGVAAMTLAVAHSRGWLDYEELVCTYWPEFAQHGKDKVTVRQLLSHQAGLFAFDEPVDKSVIADLDRLAEVLARQKPAWEPGTRQGYHAMTLGFTKASYFAGPIRSTAAWASSSRKSRRRWGWTSTSGFPRPSPTPGWRQSRRPIRSRRS